MARTSFQVQLTDNSPRWLAHQNKLLFAAAQIMGSATLKGAQITVPRDEHRRLQASGKVEVKNNRVEVSFGGGSIPYGDYQERGERADGTHKVRHYTTPNTGKHYLRNAGLNAVKRGVQWYLSHS